MEPTTCGKLASVNPILSIEDLVVEFPVPGGAIRAVDGVSLTVNPSEIVAVVGESGCGKTTLARAVLGLQPVQAGRLRLLGEEITKVRSDQSKRVGMVWQDPFASLDPKWKVGRAIIEAAKIAGQTVSAEEIFVDVGLDPGMVNRFPHQLSGGQRQRVAIGRALALRPPLVICDEPTAALDLSIRAQILNLLKKIQRDLSCSFLYISHDLTTVRFLADRVAVMYLGRIVEEGPTEALFSDPRHPYTRALLESAPHLEKLRVLPDALPGEIPDPRTRFQGCRFASRCPLVQDLCLTNDPDTSREGERSYSCHFAGRPTVVA